MASASPTGEIGGMAANGTAKAGSFLSFFAEDVQRSPILYSAFAVMLALIVIVGKLSSPNLDEREPPAMKPRIPVIGHLLGMIKHQAHFFKSLEHRNMPIATLPILNGKLYGVWDPVLIQSIYRNKDLSFEPFAVEFAQRELGFDNDTLKILSNGVLLPQFFEGIHAAMTPRNVRRMNANALRHVAKVLEDIPDGKAFESANFYVWVRDLMTIATAEALYGPENPIRKDESLLEQVWDFDAGLAMLMLGVVPSITAKKCYQARAKLQAVLAEYYGANNDDHEDAGQITKNRANVLRKHGISGHDVGKIEIALLHVSTSNTIPTLFWFIAFVFTRPDVIAQLRDEAAAVATHGENGEVTIDIAVIDERCPLLVSCYREAIRLSNKGSGNRRVMQDTTVSDGKGRSYLLKKGCNVQVSHEVAHSLERVWGSDMDVFVADRFVDSKAKKENLEAEKLKKAAWVPFGGGRHLCPGRNFAFAENLGFVASLLLGFDVTPLDNSMKSTTEPPKMDRCPMTAAAAKPVDSGEGFGVRVEKRKGWENTKWLYSS
ncbi:prostacyclin synthase [Colletotrichum karsti]|uniref:Prostacyclin synthase n=1 Tax=Colletotrichum karsti TaxID=1095194 RepID=A0A9P6I8J9_9PEZI|nr:prostacyclin synthase [Colletotrichum karsti]KAF9878224.1 prostacyclin synthase [Colletotrichum karsti]